MPYTTVAQLVKNLPAMRETWVWSLGWEDPLEKGKATHSSHGLYNQWAAKSWTWLSDFHSLMVVVDVLNYVSITYMNELLLKRKWLEIYFLSLAVFGFWCLFFSFFLVYMCWFWRLNFEAWPLLWSNNSHSEGL